MKQINYISNHPNYDEEYWNNNLKENVVRIINEELTKYYDSEFEQLFNKSNDELAQAREEFKKNHSSFIMFFLFIGAIFGIILFIYPGILAIRKYKELNAKKRNYLSQIQKKESQKIRLIIEFIEKINFNLIKDKLLALLNFNDFKPLSMEFLEEINYLNQTQFKALPEFNVYNPGNSCWTIFNNNIIIKKNNIEHKVIDKTYVGRRTVSKTVYINGRYNVETETLSSYYSHPCPIFSNDQRYLLYTDSIPELEFNYKGFSNKKIPRKHKSITLENELFYYRYNYSWNDDAKIRMFFTPFFMEQYLKINKELEPPLYLQINKRSNFLYTNNTIENSLFDTKHCISINSGNANFKKLKNYIINEYLKFTKKQYQAIKFATIFPIIQSESHLYKLKNIQVKQELNKSNVPSIGNIIFIIHYLINEYFENSFDFNTKKAIHNVNELEIKQINNFNFIWTSLDTLTYNVVPKSIVQYEYSYLLCTSVAVTIHYDDYIEENHFHNLGYFEIKNKNLFFFNKGKTHNLTNDIINIIRNIQDNCNNLVDVIINKGYFICLFKIKSKDENDSTNLEFFSSLTFEIYDLINSLLD